MESATSEASGKSEGKTWTNILVESSALDQLKVPLQGSSRLKYTCISVSRRYVALGSNTGGVYVFGRQNFNNLRVVFADMKADTINLVSLSPFDNNVGFANSMGQVFVMETNIEKRTKPEKLRMSNIHVGHIVTAVAWNTTGSQFFIGDNMGTVSIIYVSNSKAKDLFSQPLEVILNLDSAIVQMDWAREKLLLATLTRCYLCLTDKAKYFQIGKKLRDGKFGTCFYHNCSLSTPLIYSARPGSRMWEVDFEGQVLNTHQFKQLLAIPPLPILDLKCKEFNLPKDEKCNVLSVNFVQIKQIKNMLLAWTDNAIFIFDPLNVRTVLWCADIKEINDIAVIENEMYIFHRGSEIKKLSLMTVTNCISWLHSKQRHKLSEDLRLEFMISVSSSPQSSNETGVSNYQEFGKSLEGSLLQNKIIPKDMAVTTRLSALPPYINKPKEKVDENCEFSKDKSGAKTSLDSGNSSSAPFQDSNCLQSDRLSLFLNQNGIQPYIENHKSPSEFFENSMQQILIENEECDKNSILTSPENCEEPLEHLYDQEILHMHDSGSLYRNLLSEITPSSGRSTPRPVAIPRPRPLNPSSINNVLLSPSVYAMLNYTNITKYESLDQVGETEEGSPTVDAVLPKGDENKSIRKVFKKRKPTIVQLDTPSSRSANASRADHPKKWKTSKLFNSSSTVEDKADKGEKLEHPFIVESFSRDCLSDSSEMTQSADNSAMESSVISSDSKASASSSKEETPHTVIPSQVSNLFERLNSKTNNTAYNTVPDSLSTAKTSSDEGTPLKSVSDSNSSSSSILMTNRLERIAATVGEVKHEMKQYNNSMSEPSFAPVESSTGMCDDTELSLTSAKMNLMSIKDSLSSRTKSFIKSISRSSILSRGDQLVNVLKKKLPEIGDGKEIIDFQIAEEMIDPETNVDTGEEVAWHISVIESKSYADTTSLVAATDKAHEELDNVEILLHPDRVEDVIKKWLEYLHLTQNAVLHKLIDIEKQSEKDTVSTSSSDNLLSETFSQHMPDVQKHSPGNDICMTKDSARVGDKNCEECLAENYINETQQPVEKMTSSSQKIVSENEAHSMIVDSGVELFNTESQVHSSLEQESIEDKTEDLTLDMDRSIYTRGVTSSFISTSDSSFVDPEEITGNVGVDWGCKLSHQEHGLVEESIDRAGEPVKSSNSSFNDDDDDDYKEEKEKIVEEEEEKKDNDKTGTALIADSDRSRNDKLNKIVKEVTKKEDHGNLNEFREIECLSPKNMGKERISPVKTLNENCKNFHINEGFDMSGSPNFFSSDSVKKSDFGEPDFVEKVANPTFSEFSTLKDAFSSDHNIISRESALDQTDSNICEIDRSQEISEIRYNSLFSSGESKDNDRTLSAEDQGNETGSKSAMDSSINGSKSDNGSYDKKEECLLEHDTHASVLETVDNVEDDNSDNMNKNNMVLEKIEDEESQDSQNVTSRNSFDSEENDFYQKCGCKSKKQEDEQQQHDELCDPKLFMKCFVSDPFGLSLEQHKLASMLAVTCFQTNCTGDICSKVFQSSCFFRCINITSPCASQKAELSNANSSSKTIDTFLPSKSETDSPSSSSNYANGYSRSKRIMSTYQSTQFSSGSRSPKDCHGRFCHLISRFVETQLPEGTRSKLSPHPSDHVLSVEEHYDWQMSLFIRCYFHLLSLDVVRRHVYSYHGYCFRSWLALVHCLQEIGKDDIVGKCLQKKKLQQAVDLLHSEDIHFSAMICIVGHLSRLFSFRPAEIVEFSVQNSDHVQPLDVLYLSYLHNFPLHHFHSYMMARINVSFDKKSMLSKLSENNETKFTWLEYLLSKVDKLFAKDIPSLPSAGMHLLKWKYKDIIIFLCNNCCDVSVADEHWKKVLHLCLINKFWLGCLMCLKKLKLWRSLITIMVALSDLSLFDSDNTYGYVPESEEEWLYLLDQKKMQSAEDDTNAFQSSLIAAVMRCYKDCVTFPLEEYNSWCKTLEESLSDAEQVTENLSGSNKELTSQMVVSSPLTLDSVYRLFIQRMGPQRGIHLLLEHDLLKPSVYPLSFYQSCLFGSLIQRQQRFIIHNMLEKIDEYFWSKKPASMAPAIYFSVEEEKNAEYLEPSVSTQELLKQLQPLNGHRFAEEKEYHWGSSVDVFTACPCCHVTLSAVISHMESGIVIFECGHAYHRFCVGPKKMCVLCPSIL